jgi:glycosyltransferase involved in cell wall biosynthesis
MNNNSIFLSICVPTFNRTRTLIASIYFILNEINKSEFKKNIELVISDNSLESREKLLKSEISDISNQTINFRYNWNNGQNIGVAENIRKCIEQSNGEYVWIIGDDDFIIPDSLDRVLNFLKCNLDMDFLLLNRINYTIEDNLDTQTLISNLLLHIDGFKNQSGLDLNDSLYIYENLWDGVNSSNVFLGAIMLFVFRRKIWVNFMNEKLHGLISERWISELYSWYPHTVVLSSAFNNSSSTKLLTPVIVVGDGVREWTFGQFFSKIWDSPELFIHINLIPRILKLHKLNGMPDSSYFRLQSGLSYYVGFFFLPYFIHSKISKSEFKRNDIDLVEAFDLNRRFIRFYYGMIRGFLSIFILNPIRRRINNV